MGLWAALLLALLFAAPAQGAFDDPLFEFTPRPAASKPGDPPPDPVPPPNGFFNGPCGLAVDSGGRLYVADHYHDAVDVYAPVGDSSLSYAGQLSEPDPLGGPCGLALDSADALYVNRYHGGLTRYGPSPSFGAGTSIDPSPSTGVAVDPATDEAYLNHRTHVSVYEPSGAPVTDGEGEPLRIGEGSLSDGYGVAVSGFAGTAGFVYVPDASDGTVKVYDPSTDTADPVEEIDGAATPAGGFVSLRDSSIAVDGNSGDVYVVDNLQPAHTESPEAIVHVFSSTGAYEGHLKYNVVHSGPSGLAVDDSTGRVYVTSGNTHRGGLYAYPPNAATNSTPRPPTIPPEPLGGDSFFATTPIGAPASGPGGISCEGDDCQVLPPEPVDPTLTTGLRGLGNPAVRYRSAIRNCRPALRRARHLGRRARRAAKRARRARSTHPSRVAKLRKRTRRARRAARRCARANGAGTSAAAGSTSAVSGAGLQGADDAGEVGPSPPPQDAVPSTSAVAATSALLPATAGFGAAAYADGGGPATLAGSHPYQLDFSVGLQQGGGEADLRGLRIELPAGLLANPAATSVLCSAADFATPRSSPYEASASGESCPERSQVGTVEVTSGAGGGQTRRFGLFELADAEGAAMRLGASPFGAPLLFEARIDSGGRGPYMALEASAIPAALRAHGLALSLWGVPWDASHNGERGDCLNQSEPSFAWAKCSIGEPLQNDPLAFLTLPTRCGEPLAFAARASSWQGGGFRASAANRDEGGAPAPVSGCASLGFESFDLRAEGLLSTEKASSASGYVFRLDNENPGLADPRARIRSHVKRAVVELPDGVTLNPSLGAGLEACSRGDLERESAFNAPGAGCPNGAKIGEFIIRTAFYDGLLEGGVYLAEPYENRFDSLVAVYLVAKSADRGILIALAGELVPDRDDGTLTAVFDDLPQLPYTDLEVNVRSGQRAPLVSPSRCGPATTRIELSPWAAGVSSQHAETDTEIEDGIDGGRCPDGDTPPFSPDAIAGGVNSNVGSYTPYFVHLIREDTEQEITSYSLALPKGIVGKLAGIPFCPDAAIARARSRSGSDETARPSCPAASQVGRTLTGYGVGSALTYAPGKIYLAGPHNGRPLSLVTINAATVGPFDLGTIVIRSAFSVDPRTAQLAIDSSASDPIPHIVEGVPLHLRDVRVYIDRPQFTRNPTSCEASQLDSTLTGSGRRFDDPSDDSTATANAHFQLLNCLALGFRPRLGLRLRGGVRRGAYPGLRAVFRARAGDASLKRIAVTMPSSLFLAQNHIRTVCTRVQFAAGACPAGSVYGRAAANTPLFDEPLRGPVVLRSSSNKLPDLVALLRSGEVRIVLGGRIGPSKDGGIRASFDELPDAPVNRFTMWLAGGRRGLLVNSVNVCAAPPKATVKALGQNNRGAIFATRLRGECKKYRQAQRKKQKQGKQKRRNRGRGRR